MPTVNFLPPQVQEQYLNDPQTALALAMMKEGQINGPIRTPMEGWGHIAQQLAGQYANYKQQQKYQGLGQQQNDAQTQMLAALLSGKSAKDVLAEMQGNPFAAQTVMPMAMAQYQSQLKANEPVKLSEGEALTQRDPTTGAYKTLASGPAKQHQPIKQSNGVEEWLADWTGAEIAGTRTKVQMGPGEAARLAEERRYHQQSLDQGAIPAGYRKAGNGALEFIPGGPHDPAAAKRERPTEDQAKNMQLYNRASQQAKILVGDGKTPGVFDALSAPANQIGSAVGFGSPMLTGAEYQRADAALKDLAASYLYSVSGATANPGEVANLTATLRPRLGESEASVADKKARIGQMVESIKIRAAGAQVPGAGQAPAAESAAPAADGPTATNPQTGQKLILRNGQWVPL